MSGDHTIASVEEAAKVFVALILRNEEATPELKGRAIQSVLDKAGFLVAVDAWDSGSFSEALSGPDSIEAMLWLAGLLDRVPQAGIEAFVVSRIRRNRDRLEEERDIIDYEKLAEAERAVQDMKMESGATATWLGRTLRSLFG